jgi:hypothetical protein
VIKLNLQIVKIFTKLMATSLPTALATREVSQRGKAFLPPEDRVIVSGWLNISTDAATGII